MTCANGRAVFGSGLSSLERAWSSSAPTAQLARPSSTAAIARVEAWITVGLPGYLRVMWEGFPSAPLVQDKGGDKLPQGARADRCPISARPVIRVPTITRILVARRRRDRF